MSVQRAKEAAERLCTALAAFNVASREALDAGANASIRVDCNDGHPPVYIGSPNPTLGLVSLYYREEPWDPKKL